MKILDNDEVLIFMETFGSAGTRGICLFCVDTTYMHISFGSLIVLQNVLVMQIQSLGRYDSPLLPRIQSKLSVTFLVEELKVPLICKSFLASQTILIQLQCDTSLFKSKALNHPVTNHPRI